VNAPDDGAATDPVAVVLSELQTRLDALPPDLRAHAAFLSTYRRTTEAVEDAVRSEVFEDPAWVSAWDEAFARLYLAALDARISGQGRVPRPWRLAFQAPATLPPLRHVLLGINAHINFDLPQALLAVIPDSDFTDPDLVDRRRGDHGRIDGVLSGRGRGRERAAVDVLNPEPDGPPAAAREPVYLAADSQRGPNEGLAQHAPAARRQSPWTGRTCLPASRTGGAIRGPHRRPDGTGSGAAPPCHLRLRSAAPSPGLRRDHPRAEGPQPRGATPTAAISGRATTGMCARWTAVTVSVIAGHP